MKIPLIVVVTIILFFLFACKAAEDDNFDVNVVILDVYETSIHDRSANVRYTVENLDSKPIRGWEVFFNVHFPSSAQLLCTHGLSYSLEPGETSSEQVGQIVIPNYYNRAFEPSRASLKNIEVY